MILQNYICFVERNETSDLFFIPNESQDVPANQRLFSIRLDLDTDTLSFGKFGETTYPMILKNFQQYMITLNLKTTRPAVEPAANKQYEVSYKLVVTANPITTSSTEKSKLKKITKTITVKVKLTNDPTATEKSSKFVSIELPDINFYGDPSLMHVYPEYRFIRPFGPDRTPLERPYKTFYFYDKT
jgi:hypothetical protein